MRENVHMHERARTFQRLPGASAEAAPKCWRRSSLSLGRIRLVAIAAAALFLAAAHPDHGYAKTPVAWVELVGPGRQASIRVVVDKDANCPTLTADGQPLAMQVRAEPGPLLREGKLPPAADFPVRVCEVAAPEAKRVQWGDKPLPLPAAEIRRIVVFGDTGCRIKKNKKLQNCADAGKWPYAKVAAHAALAHPDLVIHVGDYLYRESCDEAACAGTQTGYGWDAWDADFFTPSAPLLAAAPWIMVRGNHENCSRAADGWFRFLFHTRPAPACAEMSPFFIVDLGGQSFVVMDSSTVAGDSAEGSAPGKDDEDDDDEAGSAPAAGLIDEIRSGYDSIAPSIPAQAWLLTHSPFYGIRRDKKSGESKIDNTIEADAIGGKLSPNMQMIVSGHIHMFESLSFERTNSLSNSQSPPQLVVGTGGDKLAKKPGELGELAGQRIAHALIVKNFAYMILDRDGANWKGTLFDEDGVRLAHCDLSNRDLICRKEP
jgi:predicted phosphodiesterase